MSEICSLDALINFINQKNQHINNEKSDSVNPLHIEGDTFETYIKRLLTNTFDGKVDDARFFSLYNQKNNPPDLIIKNDNRNGDSIEIKKIEGTKQFSTSAIALNSSQPRSKLRFDDPKITKACRECESGYKWDPRDNLYILGSHEKKEGKKKYQKIHYLWFFYGDCFAQKNKFYLDHYENLKLNIENIIGSTFNDDSEEDNSKTAELGRVNNFDSYKVSSLRVRGMYGIKNPFDIFKDHIPSLKKLLVNEDGTEKNNDANQDKTYIFFLCRKSKYDSFPNKKKLKINEFINNENLIFETLLIPDPDNLKEMIDIIFITHSQERDSKK